VNKGLDADWFICPTCSQQSSEPSHVREGFCPLCNDFTGGLGVTGELIMGQTAVYFHLSTEQLTSADRSHHISGPRQTAMFICRELTDLSFPEIGILFNRDHSTVMHGVRKIEKLVLQYARVRNHVAVISHRVTAQASLHETHEGVAYVR